MNRTEKEMRDLDVPFLKTVEDLEKYLDNLSNMNHDYGTAVYAMSMAGVAAFQYMAGRLGVTGFQANCADLDMLRRTRNVKGALLLHDIDKVLYPQYDLVGELKEAIRSQRPHLKERAKELLATSDEDYVSPIVWAHWQSIANGDLPLRDK